MSAWLAAAYACLALGLGWSLGSGVRWRRRIPFIVAAPALALWLGRPDPAGWPTARALPAHAGLVSALVREPDPAAADRGRIYLWLDVGRGRPRAFSVPYSRAAHRRVQQALGRLAHRQSVELVRARARTRGARMTSGSPVGFSFARRPPLPPKPADGPVAAGTP